MKTLTVFAVGQFLTTSIAFCFDATDVARGNDYGGTLTPTSQEGLSPARSWLGCESS